jgi:serine/threonine protein kinase
MMRRESSEINNFLQLPDTLLIYLVTILCFDAADEAHIDDTRFSLQCINKKFYSICNCKSLWQNKPIILPSGKFNDGTFKLIKRKTQGTEGICYHAYCRPHQKEYAIKRVNRIFSEDEGVPYYMLRVLSALRNLRHPGVNELLYVSLAGPKIYTIYPYVELTLQDVLSPGQKLSSPEGAVHGSEVASSAALSPLEQHVAIDMMSQLMSAISYLHDRGILHRNLKPKHILIAPPPKSSSASSYLEGAILKISDFSLARTTFHPPRDLTAEVITLWYRPPEILLGHGKYTSAVDVWSAGCVFAEMLEGRPLFAGLSEIDQLFQIFSKLGSPDTASSFRELPFYQDGIFPDWDKVSVVVSPFCVA